MKLFFNNIFSTQYFQNTIISTSNLYKNYNEIFYILFYTKSLKSSEYLQLISVCMSHIYVLHITSLDITSWPGSKIN